MHRLFEKCVFNILRKPEARQLSHVRRIFAPKYLLFFVRRNK